MDNKKIRWNGMDWFIVIVVVLVAIAGIYLLAGRGGSAVTTSVNTNVTVVAEISQQEPAFAELIKQGDVVLIGEKTKMRTTVESVEVSPARETGYDILDGRVLRSEIPEKIDVKVTLKAVGVESDSSIEIDGAPIRVGQKTILHSKGWGGEVYIIGLETDSLN